MCLNPVNGKAAWIQWLKPTRKQSMISSLSSAFINKLSMYSLMVAKPKLVLNGMFCLLMNWSFWVYRGCRRQALQMPGCPWKINWEYGMKWSTPCWGRKTGILATFMTHRVVPHIALDDKAFDTFYLCCCETATISQHSTERNLYHEETYFYCAGYFYRRLCGLNGAIFLASNPI